MKTNSVPVSVRHKSVLAIGVLVLVIFSAVVTVLTSNGVVKELKQHLRGQDPYAIMTTEQSPLSQLHEEHDHKQLMDKVSGISKSVEEMDAILNETNQVFITMPAKAAGTTMKRFTEKCTNIALEDNILNRNETAIENILTTSYELPSVIASHLRSDVPFISLVKGATRETFIIYIHREELSRVRSAINHVLISRVCARHVKIMRKYKFDIEINSNKCTVDEEHVINLIKKKKYEVGLGASQILTCGFFDAIAQNTPSNLMFVHYKQAEKLQKILAKYHCPHLVKDLPIAVNIADEKGMELFVRLKSNTSKNVTFSEWFDKKQNLILWALGSKQNMDCQSKIVDMEDHLFSCPDEAVTLFRGEFQCVSMLPNRTN
jgi:hypothetical protein